MFSVVICPSSDICCVVAMNLTQRQKEALHKKIIDLQQQLEAKQKLELEIEQLKGALNVIKHVPDEDDLEVMKRVDDMMKDLRDKEEQLDGVEALNQALIVKERRSNEELVEARKELINVSTWEFCSDYGTNILTMLKL